MRIQTNQIGNAEQDLNQTLIYNKRVSQVATRMVSYRIGTLVMMLRFSRVICANHSICFIQHVSFNQSNPFNWLVLMHSCN